MFEKIRDRIKYLKDTLKIQEEPYLECIWALKHDIYYEKGPRHYNLFSDHTSDQFTDVVASKIAKALEKSKKATGLTLFHGDVTDKGMRKILEAVRNTEAPITELNIKDFPYVTDDSIKVLPDVIREKGIVSCNLFLTHVSPEILKKAEMACKQNVAEKMKLENVTVRQ